MSGERLKPDTLEALLGGKLFHCAQEYRRILNENIPPSDSEEQTQQRFNALASSIHRAVKRMDERTDGIPDDPTEAQTEEMAKILAATLLQMGAASLALMRFLVEETGLPLEFFVGVKTEGWWPQ